MVKDFLKIYQIYFDDTQVGALDYIPVKNPDCTEFFENSVIRKLIQEGAHLDSEYFGVVSYSLRNKIDLSRKWGGDIANLSVTEFTPQLFESVLKASAPDVLSFQRHTKHDNVSLADKYHPNFSKFFKEIMRNIGYNWHPQVLNHVAYSNLFVAKSEIYERYVREMLDPAMDFMAKMPELRANSRYPKRLPVDLQRRFGLPHYPYHTFLCERMFSYFAHINNLNCLNF